MGEALAKDHVTALGSFDWFTINGVEYSMTGNSIQENTVGGNDGEALIFFELLLTQSDNESVVIPDAAFTLGIPVAQGETLTEKQMLIPIKLVAANLLRNVVPQSPTTFYQEGIAYTVTVTEAKLSPIRNLIILRVDVANTTDEITARKVIAPWSSIGLVDESGTEVGASTAISYGLPTGETDAARHFVIHIENVPLKSYPNELYIAPTGYYGENGVWTADMSHAIKLNMEEKRNEE